MEHLTENTHSGKEKNRGSEWHKWDLHMHTPYSWLNSKSYCNTSDEDFINAIKDSGIKVIGLTNYFKFAKEEVFSDNNLRQKLEKAGIAVFLNLELRLSYKNRENELCDYHILFDRNISEKDIKTFLTNLTVVDGASEVIAENLTENQLRSNNLYVDYNSLMEVVNRKSLELEGKILCGFLSSGKGNSRSSAVYERIANEADFLIHSSNAARTIENDKKYWIEDNNKPLFQGSDAHSLTDIGQKFTWIKSKLSLDGLKQAKYEPLERISFDENNPQKNADFLTIDRLELKNGEIIYFNKSLNSIIGKRGEGKTILLKAMVRRADDDELRKRCVDNNFYQSIIEWDDKVFGNGAKIIWNDKTENSGSDESPKKVLYIPQGYLSNLAYDENQRKEDRDAFITGLLRENRIFSKAEEDARRVVNSIKQQIEQKITSIFNDKALVDQLLEQNKKLGSPIDLQLEITSLSKKMKELSRKKSITKAESKRYQDSIEKISILTKKLEVLEQDEIVLKEFKNDGSLLDFDSVKSLAQLSSEEKRKIREEIASKNEKTMQAVVNKHIRNIAKRIQEAKKGIESQNQIIIGLKERFENQSELTAISKELSNFKELKAQASENLIKIRKTREAIENSVQEIEKLYFSFESSLKKIYKPVKFNNLHYATISIAIRQHSDAIIETLERFINKNKLSDVDKSTKAFIYSDDPTLSKSNLSIIIKDLIYNRIVLKSGKSDRTLVLSQLLTNPFNIDYLDSITANNEQHTNFRNMTGGQKAITILELIFELDNNRYPILLDQPEDDLDANGVADSVVSFIKEQKKHRQIFVVSHSASLVICSDSEEIVVASNNSSGFTYKTGAIEDKRIRRSIIDILEGGEKALRLRMKKLDINL